MLLCTSTHRLHDPAFRGYVSLSVCVCVLGLLHGTFLGCRALERAVAPLHQRCKRGDGEQSDWWLRGRSHMLVLNRWIYDWNSNRPTNTDTVPAHWPGKCQMIENSSCSLTSILSWTASNREKTKFYVFFLNIRGKLQVQKFILDIRNRRRHLVAVARFNHITQASSAAEFDVWTSIFFSCATLNKIIFFHSPLTNEKLNSKTRNTSLLSSVPSGM